MRSPPTMPSCQNRGVVDPGEPVRFSHISKWYCLPSTSTHGRPIVRSPQGGGVVGRRYVPSQRLKTSLQGIYTCKCIWSNTEGPHESG